MTDRSAAGANSEWVEDLLADAMRLSGTPGAAAVVVSRDEILGSAALGFADLERGRPMTVDTLCQIGSIGKTFTSVALLRLEMSGRLSLDDPLSKYLPWFRDKTITLASLASHTSGLPQGSDPYPDPIWEIEAWQGRPDRTPAGRIFHYSNLGYQLLGAAIEVITGEQLWRWLERELLAPLGMDCSFGKIANAQWSDAAVGYVPLRNDRPFLAGDELVRAFWYEQRLGDGSILAPATDLARFAQMFLGRGRIGAHEVLSPEALDRMLEPSPLADGSSKYYGLGIQVDTSKGLVVSHGGTMLGYRSVLLADLERGIGAVVFENAVSIPPHVPNVAHQLVAAASGDRPESIWPELPDAALCGSFESGTERIVVNRSGEGLKVTAKGETAPLHRWSRDWYATTHGALRLEFLKPPSADADHWTAGPALYRRSNAPSGGSAPEGRRSETWEQLVGEYRSFTPWLPHMSVFAREGSLLLCNRGGSDAPEELELVELRPLEFRVGADAAAPERVSFGAPIAGASRWMSINGCLYSRITEGFGDARSTRA